MNNQQQEQHIYLCIKDINNNTLSIKIDNSSFEETKKSVEVWNELKSKEERGYALYWYGGQKIDNTLSIN